MGGHSLTSGSSLALLGSNESSSQATAKRAAVLLFEFAHGNRTVCRIDFEGEAGASPARLDYLSAVRLWKALTDAEREALSEARALATLPMPSEENPRQDAGTGGGK
jgi:hypothetical protein